MSSVTIQPISRRGFLELALAASAGVAWASENSPGASRRPNIVFILADDLGIHDVSCYGQSRFQTPHIDRMASEGMRFTDAYAGAPVCGPSRSTLMTGLNTGHTRVRANFALAEGHVGYKGKEQIRRANLLPEDRTVADLMRRSGYHTGLVGKWHLDGYDPDATPVEHGFDEFQGWLTSNGKSQGYFPVERYDGKKVRRIAENEQDRHGLYETEMCIEEASDFIRRNAEAPFFLYLAFNNPHSPYVTPTLGSAAGEPWTRDEKIYASMVEFMDQGVGAVMRTLKETGLDEDTIIFFASDNGPRSEPTKQQTEVVNFFNSNGIYRGYKRDLYEGGIREPFIVRWPGKIAAGSESHEPVYFPDFLPTAVQIAQGPAADKTDGADLMPILRQRTKHLGERFIYWETYEPEFRQAVRWGKWKAVRLKLGGPLELYNLEADVSEKHEVAAQNPLVVRRIEEYLRTAHTDSPEYPVYRMASPAAALLNEEE
jgi:arylsulfatase A-like enzyme